MRYNNSMDDHSADFCELFADLFESVYNVYTCDSHTDDVSDPSDGCGFSSIRLHMCELEAEILGLDANKAPRNAGFSPSFVKLVASNSDFANAQGELDVFSQWCIVRGIQLNLEKWKSISISFHETFPIWIIRSQLDSVDSICDLGVVLGSKLNFTSHIDSLIVKASRMLGFMRRIGKEFRDPYTLKT
jgi:hypothetical protein